MDLDGALDTYSLRFHADLGKTDEKFSLFLLLIEDEETGLQPQDSSPVSKGSQASLAGRKCQFLLHLLLVTIYTAVIFYFQDLPPDAAQLAAGGFLPAIKDLPLWPQLFEKAGQLTSPYAAPPPPSTDRRTSCGRATYACPSWSCGRITPRRCACSTAPAAILPSSPSTTSCTACRR